MTHPNEAIFEPREGEGWRDPFGMYAALRDHDPVHHVEDGDYWALSRFRDVFDAAVDFDGAVIRDGVDADSARDDTDAQRRMPYQRMLALFGCYVHGVGFERFEHSPHPKDRVVTQVRHGAV